MPYATLSRHSFCPRGETCGRSRSCSATPRYRPPSATPRSTPITWSGSTTRPIRAPDAKERAALDDLVQVLEALPAEADAETIQTEIYEVGKRHPFDNLRDWFRALYETLLGQSQGPRFGSFVALYGKDESVALIRRVLAGESVEAG